VRGPWSAAGWPGVGSLRLPEHPAHRLYEWLRGSPTGLVALALAVGAGAGVGAVVFRYLIFAFTKAFTGYQDYSSQGHVPNPLVPALGIWFVVLAPIVGGLIYGPLIELFAREARGHGVPEVMLAVAERGGRIRPQVAVIKSLASALCIGCGGSVGREGPIVQIGSALGSALGQLVRVPEARLRLLVACGAAGGISATFNAPIAGVFFALELILRDFEIESFGVVVLASVLADVIGRAAFGAHPFLLLPRFELASPWEYAFYAGVGVLAAIMGVAFIRVLYGAEDLFDRLWRGPARLRPGAGGILLGALLLGLPGLYGVGYPVLEGAIRGNDILWVPLALLVGKIVATSLTIAIGGSGGVFAPSLFMGAMLGTAYGDVLRRFLPGITGPAGAYGLVGMGAVFAGAAQAPITSVLIIFELTGDYEIILPLMFAVVLAAGLSTRMTRDRRLTEIPWPPSSLVLAIRRNGAGFVPTGQTQLERGDRLSVLTPAEHADSLADRVGGTLAPHGRDEPAAGRAPTAPGPGRPQALIWPPKDASVLEPTVAPGSWLAGLTVRDLRLGQGVLLVAIHRDDAVVVPSGDTRLAAGDRCVIIAGPGHAGRVLGLFQARVRPEGRADGA
jgi:CIC family chloride channel protein